MALCGLLVLLAHIGYVSAGGGGDVDPVNTLFGENLGTCHDEVELNVTGGALPMWLDGSFYISGPARQNVGKTSVSNYLDGIAKMNRQKTDTTDAQLHSIKYHRQSF